MSGDVSITTILEAKHLNLAYGQKEVIQDLSFQVEQGSFFCVLGENGVGKTTLVRAILGQLKPKSGEIIVGSTQAKIKIGYVPQFRNLDEEYPLSIEEFVGLNVKKNGLPWLTKKEKEKVQRVIEQTNLTQIANRPLGQASGGEKQRAYLAQALLQDPSLLILDESTASLDVDKKYELLNLVAQLKVSVVFITHDLALAQQFADHFLLIKHDGFQTGPITQLKDDIEVGTNV